MSDPDLTLLDAVAWRGAPVPGGRSHALLAALALAAPRTVPVGDLVELVWARDEPAHPEKALQVQVSRTRSQTGAGVVARVGNGYRLGLRDDQVDLLRLRGLVADALAARAAGDLDVARLQARRALDVRVTTAADEGPLGDVVAAALDAQGRARSLLGSVLLARGDAVEALPLLETTLAGSPDDETRLAEVLRAEAQVRGVPAALAHYAAHAERIRDAVGAEPGEELRRLHADLLARDAPVRSGLKYDASPMVGRDEDVADIRALLERSRVVSIVGAGGLGKTRMAHLVGRIAVQPVVHFVELAGVTSPEGVLPEVAGALGVRESVSSVRTAQLRSDLPARVAEQLDGPPTLLVLDNCEHLVEAVADLVAFLVATLDATSVLTTSRSPLGIAAEQVYLLPQLEDADGVELFGQRARAARSDVHLDGREVGALVARLDGLPLAIELAAAKVRVMSVAEIARRLDDRFALLSGRDRSAPDRHQTLEAVIAWSWNLLGDEDRLALRSLAAFPDGFSLDGAEAVLGHDPVPALMELVDQSLLVVREGAGVRYRFLETVREYGLKQLAAEGGTDRVEGRLRDWGMASTRALVRRLFSPEQVEAMVELRAESGNIVGVMRTALERDEPEAVVPLAGALTAFWTIEGDHLGVFALSREVLETVARADAPDAGRQAELRGVLVGLIITSVIFTGSPPESALARVRDLGPAGDGSRTDALVRLVLEVYDDGQPSLSALDRLCADPDPWVARGALQWATQVREDSGDLDGAIEASRQGLALCDDRDGPWSRALFDSQVSSLYAQLGDWDAAVEHATRAIPVMRALGADEDVMQLRSVLAYADIAAGRLTEAARVLDEVAADLQRGRSLGWGVASSTGQAELALARGDVETGLQLYLEGLEVTRDRRLMGLDIPEGEMPWVLYAEASALFVHVAHGHRQDVTWLADRVRAKLPRLVALDRRGVDLPLLGGVMLGLGAWEVAGGLEDPDRRHAAVRLVALGHRFGYHRGLPSLGWDRVRRVVEAAAPGELDPVVASYAAVASRSLLGEARDAVAVLS